jgi:DNA-binding Lrp family transcriptional regulator
VIKMDEMDLYIINKMTEDARVSFRKIAKELSVSPDTIITRYKKLQSEGIIRGSTVIIDPKKIGYNCMTVFMIKASSTRILVTEPDYNTKHILTELIKMKNIILATKTVGDHDLLAIGVIKNFKHLMEAGTEIAKIAGVEDLEISFWIGKMEMCPKYFII